MSVVEAAVAARRSRPRIFIVLALLLLALVVAGFGPTFFFRPFLGTTDFATGERGLPPHLIAHGLALTGWYVLFVVQAALAATGRVALHRRLGMAGVLLAVALIVTSAAAIVGFAPRTIAAMTAGGADAVEIEAALRRLIGSMLVASSGGLLLFTVLFGAGVHFRRSPATHKRLMVLASLVLLGPALSPNRFLGQLLAPFPALLLQLALLGGVAWYDRATTRRVHPATWCGIAGTILLFAAILATVNSDVGLEYARWLASFT